MALGKSFPKKTEPRFYPVAPFLLCLCSFSDGVPSALQLCLDLPGPILPELAHMLRLPPKLPSALFAAKNAALVQFPILVSAACFDEDNGSAIPAGKGPLLSDAIHIPVHDPSPYSVMTALSFFCQSITGGDGRQSNSEKLSTS